MQSPLTPFFLMQQAQEKGLCGKRSAGNVSPLASGDQGSAFGNRKLLKKFDQNFHKTARRKLSAKGIHLFSPKTTRAVPEGTAPYNRRITS